MQILILIPLYAKLIHFPSLPPDPSTSLHNNQTLNQSQKMNMALLAHCAMHNHHTFPNVARQHFKTLLKQGLKIWDLWSCASASESTILCFCISLLNMRSREEVGVISCLHFVSQRSRWGVRRNKITCHHQCGPPTKMQRDRVS